MPVTVVTLEACTRVGSGGYIYIYISHTSWGPQNFTSLTSYNTTRPLRMKTCRSNPKQIPPTTPLDEGVVYTHYVRVEDVHTLPTTVVSRPREDKNSSKPSPSRYASSVKLLFCMSASEMRNMTILSEASAKIVDAEAHFINIYHRVGGEPLPCVVGGLRAQTFTHNLTRMTRNLYFRIKNLEDLVKHANIDMLKAIHMFFRGVRRSRRGGGDVRKYFKAYDTLLDKEALFMRQFGREANPEKQREVLLKKLENAPFALPKLFTLYTTLKSISITLDDLC